jgi:hypothetical protein
VAVALTWAKSLSRGGRRASLGDADRRSKAPIAGLGAMARPEDALSHAAFRTRWQSLFDEPQR